MKAVLTLFSFALITAGNVAFADANMPLKPPRVYTGIHPPTRSNGPSRPSSFAPRPGNKRHVYGAPIQNPILSRQVPKKRPSL